MKRKNTLLAGLVASALLAMPLYAEAAGMGRIKVNSALGQPFRAEIELTAVAKDDIDLITARLATPEQYRDAKLERPDGLAGLRFSVDKRPNGEVYLRVTSSQAINEPFLNLLIQLDWPSGRLLREYTVLLDPPGFQESAVTPTVTPPQAAAAPKVEAPATPAIKPAPAPKVAAPAKPAPKAAPVVKAEPPAPAPALTPAEQTFPRFDGDRELPPLAQTLPAAPAVPAKAEPAQYTTKPGDTLSKIAREMAPEGVSLERMMVALYQSNRAAFAGDNMNRLKSGQLLKVPDASAMAGVSQQDAVREIRAQTADWNTYRQRLAGAVAEAPAAEAPAQQVAAGTITAKAEDKAPAPAEAGKDVLKLSKADAGAAGKGTGGVGEKGLQDRLSAAQEEAAAKAKALAEANARIAELEKNVKDMQALMELKNKQLADLERQAKAAPPAAAPAPEPKPAPTPAVVPEAAPAPAAEAAAPPPEPLVKAIPDEKPAEPAVAAAPEPKPKPKVEPKAKPVTVAEESLLDTLMGNPLYLGGGAAALVGGLFAGLWALGRRRKKSLASFEDSIMTGGGDLKANTVFGNTAGGQIDTGDTSFLTDFSQAGMGAIDTNDVDPIAEAEVYMAYGRDAQAEEILKEALNKDPNRHEIHLKLLEIYAGRKNTTAFETLASELYAATGGQGPVWEKAAELGRGIDASNPLYAPPSGKGEAAPAGGGAAAAVASTAAAVAAGAAAASADLDFNLDVDTRPGETPPEAPVPDLGATLDFNLDTEPPTVASVQEAADSGALDFDIDTIIPQAVEKLAEAPAAPAEAPSLEFEPPALDTPTLAQAPKAEEDTLALDFDFNLEPSTPVAAPASEPVTEPMMPELDLSGIDLNLGTGSADEIPTLDEATTVVSDNTVWEEASTKLDLARAYMEMGDRDGAREILQEVLSEGGPEQQEDAKKLLETLS